MDVFCAVHDRALGISPVTSFSGAKRHLREIRYILDTAPKSMRDLR